MDYKVLAVMPQKLAFGFELAGISSVAVSEPDETRRVIRDLLRASDVGVVLLHEKLYETLDSRLKSRVLDSVIPLFLVISPEEAGERNVEAYVEKLIKDAVGYSIRLQKHSA